MSFVHALFHAVIVWLLKVLVIVACVASIRTIWRILGQRTKHVLSLVFKYGIAASLTAVAAFVSFHLLSPPRIRHVGTLSEIPFLGNEMRAIHADFRTDGIRYVVLNKPWARTWIEAEFKGSETQFKAICEFVSDGAWVVGPKRESAIITPQTDSPIAFPGPSPGRRGLLGCLERGSGKAFLVVFAPETATNETGTIFLRYW